MNLLKLLRPVWGFMTFVVLTAVGIGYVATGGLQHVFADRELSAVEVSMLDEVVSLKRGDLVEFHDGSVAVIAHDIYPRSGNQNSKEWTEIRYHQMFGMRGECPELLARIFVKRVKSIIPYGHKDYGLYAHKLLAR